MTIYCGSTCGVVFDPRVSCMYSHIFQNIQVFGLCSCQLPRMAKIVLLRQSGYFAKYGKTNGLKGSERLCKISSKTG